MEIKRAQRERSPMVVAKGDEKRFLSEAEAHEIVREAVVGHDYGGKCILLIVPNHTCTALVATFFRLLHEAIAPAARTFSGLIAPGVRPRRGLTTCPTEEVLNER